MGKSPPGGSGRRGEVLIQNSSTSPYPFFRSPRQEQDDLPGQRFRADIEVLIRRNPAAFADLLNEIAEDFGIRAAMEEAVFRRARLGRPQLEWCRP
jgi:hypothetical protein